VDKFSMTKLTKTPSKKIRPSGIAESPITLECVVAYMNLFGDHYLVVGKVVEEHVRKTTFSPLLHHTGDSYMEARAIKS
ncbi:MAG: flavin reductase, partial [Nitrososphaerota archaeon]